MRIRNEGSQDLQAWTGPHIRPGELLDAGFKPEEVEWLKRHGCVVVGETKTKDVVSVEPERETEPEPEKPRRRRGRPPKIRTEE